MTMHLPAGLYLTKMRWNIRESRHIL